MKKFMPVEGGHRFRLDDLMLMQEAFIDALKGVVAGLHPSLNAIMSGVKVSVSGGAVTITEGFVSFKGEVYRVDGVSFPFKPLPDRLFLKVTETVLVPSPVTYQAADTNGDITHNVHLEYKLVPKYFNAADGDSAGDNGMYYDEITFGGNQTPGAVIEWDPMYPGEETAVWDSTGLGVGRMKGWAICNGLNNTPDLRGQFTFQPSTGMFNPAPLLTNTIDGAAVGNRFGKKEINILQANLPSYNLPIIDPGHTHDWTIKGMDFDNAGVWGNDYSGSGTNTLTYQTSSHTTGITVQSGGGNQPLTNLPPSRAMLKIKRIDY